MSRKPKKSITASIFGGIIKLFVITTGTLTMIFVLLSGNISVSLSFNKQQTKPVSLIEKAGKAVKLAKKGYDFIK